MLPGIEAVTLHVAYVVIGESLFTITFLILFCNHSLMNVLNL